MEKRDKDKEFEQKLKMSFWKKRKLLGMIKKAKLDSESSLSTTKHHIVDNEKSKENQKCIIDHETNPQKKKNSEILYQKNCQFEVILNMIGFVDIALIDLFSIMINLITASGDWDKKFYARIACMNLYELTNDILELFGNDKDGNGIKRGVRPIVNDINDATLTQIINEIRQNFANFHNKINKNGKNYANVRNLSVAHRDHDFRTQYESINNLSWGEVIEDFMEFNTLLYYLRLFNNYLTSLFSVKYNQDIQPVLDSIRERMKETEGDKI
jgi:hypothetical protein